MEYNTTRRYPQNVSLGFPHYYFMDRNTPLAMSHVSKTDPRNCPIGDPTNGLRGRGNVVREDGAMETAQSRRRIAVACARCRKRKIRCSGDPGNGSGCQNCKQAGVDMISCQFHRVGSDDAHQMIANRMTATSLACMVNPNEMMPIYNAGSSPFYTRSVPTNHYHQLDTKTVYPNTWTVPYSEDTSPTEAYSLDQSTTYMQNPNNLTNVYGDNYKWNQTNRKHLLHGHDTYLEQENSIPNTYLTHSLPYIQTNLRAAGGSEVQSPLNMASLQATLPVPLPQRPRSQHMQVPEAGVPQRQLPIPHPSSTQSSRNVVDQLQDQRLRSSQSMGGSSLKAPGSYSKAAMTWNPEPSVSEIQGNITTDTSSADLMAQATSSTSVSGVSEGVMGYVPVTNAVSEAVTESSSPPSQSQPQQQQQQINFNASTLLETMPAPAITSTYSNFRNYTLPSSSSSEQPSVLVHQNSHNSLYSFNSDSASKRHSTCDQSNEALLVSGQRYTPLSQPEMQHAAGFEDLRRDEFGTRHAPLQRASMSNLNHSY